MEDWRDFGDLPETSDEVIRALFWGRLHVRAAEKSWTTDWKVLKVAWIPWLGSRVNGTPRDPSNWYHPDDLGIRIVGIEATDWMPLPDPPSHASQHA